MQTCVNRYVPRNVILKSRLKDIRHLLAGESHDKMSQAVCNKKFMSGVILNVGLPLGLSISGMAS